MSDKARGVRFAPSPTGTFHIGNLRTAWISHWWARHLGEPWVVRFEDIDRPRVLSGAQAKQLADMASLGLKADELVQQSARIARHQALFGQARASGVVYPCYCSRKEVLEALNQAASAPHREVPVYSGRCRAGSECPPDYSNPSIAWRFKNSDETGAQDFIVARTTLEGLDFTPAYHWACAIDDYDGNYRLLVRAWDLASAANQQRAVFSWLSTIETPREYPHIYLTALVTDNTGHRLEKRTKGVTLDELLAQGRDAGWILQKFDESFKDRTARDESKKEMTLDELIGR